tara:strand:- start:50 stop:274 length:225 start_codon:yes stop_codon:yes gene_type:complete
MKTKLINITATELNTSIRMFWNVNGKAIERTSMGNERTTVWLSNGAKTSFDNKAGTCVYTTVNAPRIETTKGRA